jgi:hypothetical protein
VDAESEIVTVPAPQPEPVGKGKPADVQRVVAKANEVLAKEPKSKSKPKQAPARHRGYAVRRGR